MPVRMCRITQMAEDPTQTKVEFRHECRCPHGNWRMLHYEVDVFILGRDRLAPVHQKMHAVMEATLPCSENEDCIKEQRRRDALQRRVGV